MLFYLVQKGGHLAKKKEKQSSSNVLLRCLPGLCFGAMIALGIGSSGDPRINGHLRELLFCLCIMGMILFAFSRMPVIGWIMGSVQRGLLPRISKAGVERFLWQNALAALVISALIRYLHGS